MWVLQNSENREIVHYLLCGISLNVARQGKEHICLPDKSISKQHASFYLTHEEKHLNLPEKLPQVLLSDLHSTNGTFVNTRKITPESPVRLKSEDIIRFGTIHCWSLFYHPFVSTSSQISSREVKATLKEHVKCLGGHLLKEWTDKCAFLIMTDLVLTAKTVRALAAGSYIVSPKYLSDMIEAVKLKQPLPDPKDYLPPLKEPSLNPDEVSFLPDSSRKKLFSGKTFIFQGANSYNNMKNVVSAAGGSHALISTENCHKVCRENHLLIKIPEKDKSNSEEECGESVSKALKLLNENRLSLVPESDIGLAIVYRSIEKYCNPGFKINGILQSRGNYSQLSRDLVVYATETQHQESVTQQHSHPVSCTTIVESAQSTKGKVPSSFSSTAKSSSSVSTIRKGQGQVVSLSDASQHSNTEKDSVPREDAENKENFGKRKRALSNEQTFVSKKTKSKKEEKEINALATTEATTTIQDVVDEGSHFAPMHFSTQRESVTPKRKQVEETSPIEKGTMGNVRTTHGAFTDMDSSLVIQENTFIPKSIPFEPYTLPSIHMEEEPSLDSSPSQEQLTLPFLSPCEIKQEPQSQAPQEREKKSVDANESGWIGTNTVNKRNERKPEGRRALIKEEVQPVVSAAAVEGDFALPFSRRRRGRGTSEERSPVQEESPHPKRVRLADIAKVPTAGNVEKIPSKPEVQKMEPNSTRNQNNSGHSVFLEPIVKKEKLQKEISDLSDDLSKSLIVVQMVSLVRKTQAPFTVAVKDDGLYNFKRFKKVLPKTAMTSLPRIIGGQALVCHTALSDHRESFASQEDDLSAEIEKRDRERRMREDYDKSDSDFNLVVIPSRNHRRVRV